MVVLPAEPLCSAEAVSPVKGPPVLASLVSFALILFPLPAELTTHNSQPAQSPGSTLEGLNAAIAQRDAALHGLAMLAEAQRQRSAAQARPRPSAPRTTATPAVTGSCAAMKPAGFPDYIIQRESGGNPNAVNRSSGAQGCAQIMPAHFRSGGGCAGMSYAACWNHLWAGGAGASNWR